MTATASASPGTSGRSASPPCGGGTIVGEHTVVFAGRDEVVEISHHAASREVFAVGAVKAAKFLAGVDAPGLYDMSHLIEADKVN